MLMLPEDFQPAISPPTAVEQPAWWRVRRRRIAGALRRRGDRTARGVGLAVRQIVHTPHPRPPPQGGREPFGTMGYRPMKLEFDAQADAVYLELIDVEVEESAEIQPGIIIDYDAEGRIVGIEVLYVSKRAELPLRKAA